MKGGTFWYLEKVVTKLTCALGSNNRQPSKYNVDAVKNDSVQKKNNKCNIKCNKNLTNSCRQEQCRTGLYFSAQEIVTGAEKRSPILQYSDFFTTTFSKRIKV